MELDSVRTTVSLHLLIRTLEIAIYIRIPNIAVFKEQYHPGTRNAGFVQVNREYRSCGFDCTRSN